MSSPPRLGKSIIGARPIAPASTVDDPGEPPRNRRPVVLAVLVAIATLALTAVVAYRAGTPDTVATAPAPTASATPTGPPTTAEIYAAVAPSVVSIEAVRKGASSTGGTGVVVNADGSILTAYHVVKAAGTIKVTFADGTEAKATIAAADPANDIAVLSPDGLPSVLVPAVLGGSGQLAVGNQVVAIGNQLGLTFSTTTGVVSGLARSAPNPDGGRLKDLIQFDAAVNHGSSGGPLLNSDGGVIGIVVALVNPTDDGTFIGIGFAVPIGTALGGGGDGQQGPQL